MNLSTFFVCDSIDKLYSMTILKSSMKISIILVLLLANYFASFEASTLYPNTSHANVLRFIEKERRALLKFKEDAVDPFGILSSWIGHDCSTWEGVGCLYPTGEVIWLHLTGDTFNYSGVYLGGKISYHLNDLQHLRYLNLSYNNFYGMIPSQIGNLSNLQVLDLRFVGHPTYVSDLNWISSLSSLKYLDLSRIDLSLAKTHWVQAVNTIPSLEVLAMFNCSLETIPPSLPQTNLTSLFYLDLSENWFNTLAPQWISNLTTNLQVLSLRFCIFTGPISSFFDHNDRYYRLEFVDLSQNFFSGEIPESLEHFISLRTLILSFNSISGPVPISIGKLSKLEGLALADNVMNGDIPKSLGRLGELRSLSLGVAEWDGNLSQDHFENLSKLEDLVISSLFGGLTLHFSSRWVPPFNLASIFIRNCNLGPEFPKWLQTQTQLASLGLRNASISDTIPSWFWKLTPRLHTLDLLHNQLRGSIPVNIGQMMPSVTLFDLSRNSLSGSIPLSLLKITNLTFLGLSNNNLSGKIPNRWTQNLRSVDFSNNNISGEFPSSLLSLPYLSELKLSNNNIVGELPIPSTTSSKYIRFMDLGDNKLSGSISEWIGERFTYLVELRMRGNMFNGTISEQYCRLQSLRVLDLAQNNLSGTIPACLSRLSAMYSIDVDNRYTPFGIDLNLKGNTYTYQLTVLSLVRVIDLSCNHLSGIIPEDITNLKGLGTLNFSNNHLTGNIPSRIGDMRNLETLDLSSNQIYGQIPPSISSVTTLSHLNLSHNNLTGPIPSGTQLSTFDETIYEGNLGLCGSPLPKCVSLVQEEGRSDLHDVNDFKEDGKLGLIVSIALGFIFGFWCFCGTLVAKRSWRRAYFGVIEKIIDRIALIIKH